MVRVTAVIIGHPRRTLAIKHMVYAWMMEPLILSIVILRLWDLLSAISSTSHLPVGIRFRMYSQATTTGAVVPCTTRTPTGAGGLPRLAAIVTRTTCSCIAAFSVPRITVIRPAGFLSAASPSVSPFPVGIRFRMYLQAITHG